jgi:hypothetical protein
VLARKRSYGALVCVRIISESEVNSNGDTVVESFWTVLRNLQL